MLRQLRFGRGLDNRKLKSTGYTYRYTSREAVLKLRAHQRLRPMLRSGGESYRYEREVEEFLRWSPSVTTVRGSRGAAPGAWRRRPDRAGRGAYDDLAEGELIELIATLDTDALQALRSYEIARGRRVRVLEALDRNLARRGAADTPLNGGWSFRMKESLANRRSLRRDLEPSTGR